MNPKQYQSSLGRTFYCFLPLIIYLGINTAVSMLFFMAVAVRFMSRDANLSVEDLTSKALDYTLSANSKLMIFIAIVILIIMGIMFLKQERKTYDLKYQNNIHLKNILGIISLSLGIYMAVSVVLTITFAIFSGSELVSQYSQTMDLLTQDKLWIDILAVGILAPVSEELVFRGLVFNRLRYFVNERGAILTSAFIFGMMHMPSVIQVGYAFVLGYILAYAYSKFENILVPILIHMIFNLSNFLFMIDAVENIPTNNITSLIYYAIMIALCSLGLRMIVKKQKPSLKL